ncbi:FliH/SctL family protein [Halanaerobaculum tunisiense]
MSNVIKSNQIKTGTKFDFSHSSQQEEASQEDVTASDQQEESEKIIVQAEQKAAEIIAQAKEEAQEIKQEATQQAQQEIEAAKEQAHKEGYQAGFAEGQQEAQEEAVAEFKEFMAQLEEKSATISQLVEEELAQVSSEVLELVTAISRQVINRELSLDDSLILDLVKDALLAIEEEKEVKIRINPQDLEVLSTAKEELIKTSNLEEIELVTDQSIDLGGCIIETDFGGVDATISSQLAQIEEELRTVNDNE